MPTVITHAVAGAAISTLAPRRFRGVKLVAVLAVAAALPDLDVVGFWLGIPYAHPLGHRGLSHSLPFALVLSIAVWWWLTRGSSRVSRSGGALFLVVMLACASHGVLDAFTDAGLGVGFFVPFSNARYFFPWRPILTSPLSITAFFHQQGFSILRNEVEWVWLPIGLTVAIIAAMRRLLPKAPQ